jgi:hypothetical protein
VLRVHYNLCESDEVDVESREEIGEDLRRAFDV